MILADKIILERKKNGWSQEELAEKLNVSRQSVSKWESAMSVPELGKVLQLAEIFGVSTDYLLKDENGEEAYAQNNETANGTNSNNVRRVTMEEANEFLSIKAVTAKRVALGVFMCILSPITLLLLGAASEQAQFNITDAFAGGVGIITLLVIVAAAVAIFISCGMKTSKFEFLESEDIETEYGVSGMVKERMARYKDTYTKYNIIGACTCILAAVPLLAAAFLTENDFNLVIALSLMLLIVGIGVVFFIVSGVINSSMQKLLEEGDYTKEKKHKNKKTGAISTVYWLITTAIYLAYSFINDDFNTGWIIWPVAGVLYAAVITLAGVFMKDNK